MSNPTALEQCSHRGDVLELVDRFQQWKGYECPYCEIDRLKAKLTEVARLLDEGAYGMATDEARGA